jgi:NAD(P)H dehydrogenase (quinone)
LLCRTIAGKKVYPALKNKTMILVTGANGKLGSATIDFLLKKKPEFHIAALVRTAAKGEALQSRGVELRIGDYTDYLSLEKALDGVEVLVFISSGTIANRTQQHRHVIQAAQEKNVKHILYTSFLGTSDNIPGIFQDHVETEKELQNSGMAYTIFRNTFYDDLLPMLVGDALQSGHIYYPAGSARVNLVSRRDIAEAMANVVVNPEPHKNKIYEITSTNAYSLQEIAQMLSESAGKQITYTDIPFEQLKESLKSTGFPEGVVNAIASVSKMIRNGYIDHTDKALENLLQRKPVDLRETVEQFVKKQN